MFCAPIIFNFLLDAKPHDRHEIVAPIEILTAAAPLPLALIPKLESLGFHITHVSWADTLGLRLCGNLGFLRFVGLPKLGLFPRMRSSAQALAGTSEGRASYLYMRP